MKFCPIVPEICRGQVHGPRKERKKDRKRIIIIIIIRIGAKTISLQTLFGRLKYPKRKCLSITGGKYQTRTFTSLKSITAHVSFPNTIISPRLLMTISFENKILNKS
jgi:hypothetical protein